FQNLDRLVRFHDDDLFAVGQLQRPLFLGPARLLVRVGPDRFIHPDRAVVNFDLDFQHAPAALLQLGQQPLDFLLAKLPQNLFQLLERLVELGNRLALLLGSILLVFLLYFILGLTLILVGVLNLLLAGRAVGRLVWILLRGIVLRLVFVFIPRLPLLALAWLPLALAVFSILR